MVDAQVILLSDEGWDRAPLAAELVGHGVAAFQPELGDLPEHLPAPLLDARRVALTALWLNDHAVPAPVVMVAYGDSARLLPALSLSQRSAHRLVTGYVIVDAAATPVPSLDWPDAPVWWVTQPSARPELRDGALSAHLRGFHVMEGQPALAAILAALG